MDNLGIIEFVSESVCHIRMSSLLQTSALQTTDVDCGLTTSSCCPRFQTEPHVDRDLTLWKINANFIEMG